MHDEFVPDCLGSVVLLDNVVDVLGKGNVWGQEGATGIDVQTEGLTVTVELTRSAKMNETMKICFVQKFIYTALNMVRRGKRQEMPSMMTDFPEGQNW